MWNFKVTLWNSIQNISPIHWKIWFLHNINILRAFRFKSSYTFLKRPPAHGLLGETTMVYWHVMSLIFMSLSQHATWKLLPRSTVRYDQLSLRCTGSKDWQRWWETLWQDTIVEERHTTVVRYVVRFASTGLVFYHFVDLNLILFSVFCIEVLEPLHMITQIMWITWTSMSAIWERLLNDSLTHST